MALYSLDGVAKFFQRGPTTIRALDGVDFNIQRGQTLGVVGEATGSWFLPLLHERILTIEDSRDIASYLMTQKNADASYAAAAFMDIASDEPRVPWDITARVSLDAPDATAEQAASLHAYARERCPLTQLIRTANTVTIVVEM